MRRRANWVHPDGDQRGTTDYKWAYHSGRACAHVYGLCRIIVALCVDAASGLITWTLSTVLSPSQAVTVTFAVTNPASTPYGTPVVNAIYSVNAPDVPGVAMGTPMTVTAINSMGRFYKTTPVRASKR